MSLKWFFHFLPPLRASVVIIDDVETKKGRIPFPTLCHTRSQIPNLCTAVKIKFTAVQITTLPPKKPRLPAGGFDKMEEDVDLLQFSPSPGPSS
jgi:hypothetical protein